MKQFKNKEGFIFQFYDEEYELTQIGGGLEKTLGDIFGIDINLKDFSGKSITPKLIYNGLVSSYPKANTTKLALELLIRKYKLTQNKVRIIRYDN